VAYSLAKTTKTMDFCQLFCGFEPTLGNLLNPLYHGPRQMAKWQRKNIYLYNMATCERNHNGLSEQPFAAIFETPIG
jgi:hypothetical protein